VKRAKLNIVIHYFLYTFTLYIKYKYNTITTQKKITKMKERKRGKESERLVAELVDGSSLDEEGSILVPPAGGWVEKCVEELVVDVEDKWVEDEWVVVGIESCAVDDPNKKKKKNKKKKN
jgi:hypothetical protein